MQSARPIVDELVRLCWNDGRTELALEVAERGRELGPSKVRLPGEAPSWRRLPRDYTHLVYHVLPEKLLLWSIARGELHPIERPVAAERLERSVTALEKAIDAQSDDGCLQALRELHSLLLGSLPLPGSTVVVVTDGAVARVPFAALLDPQSGRHLVEDVATYVSPSLTALLEPDSNAAGVRRFLVVAPQGGGPRLTHVESEIAAIRRAFQAMAVESERTLTPARFALLAPEATYLHFAGHATSAPRANGYGHLIFGDAAEATVSADEIAAMRLSKLRLVMLAACESSARNATAEGSLTLARAFLAAGAQSVVGTLWAVDDEAASVFSREFYRNLAARRSEADAVRAAQLELLGRGRFRSPVYWAAFQLSGHGGQSIV